MLSLIFIVTSLIVVFAGNVIVKEGELTAESSVNIKGDLTVENSSSHSYDIILKNNNSDSGNIRLQQNKNFRFFTPKSFEISSTDTTTSSITGSFYKNSNTNRTGDTKLRVYGDGTGNEYLEVYHDGFDGRIESASGDLQISANSSKVGIGVTNPSTELEVAGNVTITNLAGSGNAYVCVNSNGKLYRSSSACI